MKNTVMAIMAVASVGCANITPPIDVSTVPNDCANKTRIIAYLGQLANQPRQPLESQNDYIHTRSSYRARIWHIRYNCDIVRN